MRPAVPARAAAAFAGSLRDKTWPRHASGGQVVDGAANRPESGAVLPLGYSRVLANACSRTPGPASLFLPIKRLLGRGGRPSRGDAHRF
jgi:hypothetical protein